jgi:peptide/nickel transport system permease protein
MTSNIVSTPEPADVATEGAGGGMPARRSSVWPLTKFALRRAGLGVVIMFAVTLIVFAATQALPGDAAVARLGRFASPAALKSFREHYHLNEPVLTQYFAWLGEMLHGRLGNSLATGVSVTTLISGRIDNTFALMLMAAVIGVPLALLLGIVQARYRDSRFDHGTNGFLVALAALPEFVVGIALIFLLATNILHIFAPASLLDPTKSPWEQLNLVILPAITLALVIAPYISRMIRASMVEVLESDYVAMARLKGLSERRVLFTHAFVNAAGPTIQVIALCLIYLMGGVVLVETVFQYPGIGLGLVQAIQTRDLPVIQALVLLIALVYVIINLTADLITIIVSPRARTSLK